MPQWSATFPGLQVYGADMLHTHGVTPSVCVLTCEPTPGFVNRGSLEFRENGIVKFAFHDCALTSPTTLPPQFNRSPRIRVNVLDRRWKWRYRRVNGRYNRRNSDGSIVTGTHAD